MRRYCDGNCRDGYRADLRYGLIYGSVGIPDTPENHAKVERYTHQHIIPRNVDMDTYPDDARPTILIGSQDYHDLTHTCRYCGAPL